MEPSMIAYSWNMLFRNKERNRALSFIAESDFDVFCLQEVPEEFLRQLQEKFEHVVYAAETSRWFAGSTSTQYLVTISRYPLLEHVATPIEHTELATARDAALVTKILVSLRVWGFGFGTRHMLTAKTSVPGIGAVTVYNLHLPLRYPRIRLQEFETLLANRDRGAHSIVCGDFNILEKPHITILNWLMGGTLADALYYRRERMHIERQFVEYRLANPLRGKHTHPISRSQLDHILVSDTLHVTQADVIQDRYGSDHHPIRVLSHA